MAAVERAGEPFTFGFAPDELRSYLGAVGLELLDDESTADALARLGNVADDASPPGFYHVALAAVGGRERLAAAGDT